MGDDRSATSYTTTWSGVRAPVRSAQIRSPSHERHPCTALATCVRSPLSLSYTQSDPNPDSLRAYATFVASGLKHHVRCPGPHVGPPCSHSSSMTVRSPTMPSASITTFATPFSSLTQPNASNRGEFRGCWTAVPGTDSSPRIRLDVHAISGRSHEWHVARPPCHAASTRNPSSASCDTTHSAAAMS